MKNNRFKLKYRFKLLNKRFNHFFPFLLIMIAGYALMQSSVNIKGTLGVVENSWNVYFENLVVNPNSINTNAPTIIEGPSNTSISFAISLEKIDEYFEFEVDMVNDGTIDAMINNVRLLGLPIEYKNNIIYTINYIDGGKVRKNDFLNKKSQKRIKIHIGFAPNINIEEFIRKNNINENGLNLSLNIEIDFVQAGVDSLSSSIEADILGVEMIAYSDDKKSPYVISENGIDFSKISSNTNGNGLYLMHETEKDENPIYYFRGEIDNNNVLFANKCWKIIRTTETGGTKLIYNGVPSSDGSCNNSGSKTGIGVANYNNSNKSISDVNFMYESVLTSKTFTLQSTASATSSRAIPYKPFPSSLTSNLFYYSKTFTFSNNTYNLDNPVQLGKWPDIYDTFSTEGYYTCFLTTSDGCANLYYILPSTKSSVYALKLNNGLTLNQVDAENVVGSDVIVNEDGTYTLSGEIFKIKASQWGENIDLLEGKYICDSTSEMTCKDMEKIISATQSGYKYEKMDDVLSKVIFGSDVEWDGEKYILKDSYTKESGETYFDALKNETLKDKKYFCLFDDDSCKTVNYIIYSSTSFTYYQLNNGDKIEDLVNKTLDNSDNALSSNTKKKIDEWFNSELIDYRRYLEDTVWCNDKEFYSFGISDNNFSKLVYFSSYDRVKEGKTPSLNCSNKRDRYTLKKDAMNSNSNLDENGLLDNPVGLITADEAGYVGLKFGVANASSYLNSNVPYFTMTPYYFNANLSILQKAYVLYIGANASVSSYMSSMVLNVRPVISLHSGVVAKSGDGSFENPFVIE